MKCLWKVNWRLRREYNMKKPIKHTPLSILVGCGVANDYYALKSINPYHSRRLTSVSLSFSLSSIYTAVSATFNCYKFIERIVAMRTSWVLRYSLKRGLPYFHRRRHHQCGSNCKMPFFFGKSTNNKNASNSNNNRNGRQFLLTILIVINFDVPTSSLNWP